ncbi:MAG TPA: HAD-IIA family hydrolase [Thermomicrobiales bacterium]|nr:HAD-IIA family hydrolase [Thermomicrobiales bacterium]
MTEQNEMIRRMVAAKGWIFDMDGVLYRGTEHLPGVQDFFDELGFRGLPFRLATNNSMATAQEYVQRLAGMQITVTADKILTSAMATRTWVLEHLGTEARIHVLGAPSLTTQMLDGTNFTLVDPDNAIPDAVIVGLDREFTYDKLRKAHIGIMGGAKFVATNADVTLPTERGLMPGCGTLIAAIAASTGVQPVVIGKPEVHLLDAAMSGMGVSAQQTVMVGDRLDTDIVAGHNSGTMTVMVLTGVSTREEIPTAPVKPDLLFTDLPAMLDALRAATPVR